MSGSDEIEIVKDSRPFGIHIPIPYGCLGLIAIILGGLTTLVAIPLAVGLAILK